MTVDLIRYPTEYDWMRCKFLALNTVGKIPKQPVTSKWKRKILKSGHSPIRTLMFTVRLYNVPYWVSMHFRTHKYGVEHYVSSQRNDRQDNYDRTKAPQDSPVTHVMDINAQELIFMAHRRLCNQAAPETREAMQKIKDAVVEVCPEIEEFLNPPCVRYGYCDEFHSCSRLDAIMKARDSVR